MEVAGSDLDRLFEDGVIDLDEARDLPAIAAWFCCRIGAAARLA